MAEMTERRSWRSQLYWMGVLPVGAHVRRRTSCSIKPLSSEKTMLHPCRSVFFYTRPIAFSSTSNGLFVAFVGPTFWFLATEAQRTQQVPDVVGMISHPKARLLQPPADRSTDLWKSLPQVALLEGFSVTPFSAGSTDGTDAPDEASLSRHLLHFFSGLLSNGAPRMVKPPPAQPLRKYSCLATGALLQFAAELPILLRFLSVSCGLYRQNIVNSFRNAEINRWDGGGDGHLCGGANNWDPNIVPDGDFVVTIDSNNIGVGEIEVSLQESRTINQLSLRRSKHKTIRKQNIPFATTVFALFFSRYFRSHTGWF